eukprot:CAMPEP_0194398064 /NCGR_PEP_ID=MMETSP0174-20130528/125893_1 /TAXON_ID=216777 /ORGANISM="Proboscia alata, Strain PI-D3" /LENGTH=800 /DNA_ID=CAMNT_0039194313 /DNA_START=905 /DNA_END=3304 /DNA_ORIENTATION=-
MLRSTRPAVAFIARTATTRQSFRTGISRASSALSASTGVSEPIVRSFSPYQKHRNGSTSSTSVVAVNGVNGASGDGDTEREVIRRTAARVVSKAIQRVVSPEGSELELTPTFINDGFYYDITQSKDSSSTSQTKSELEDLKASIQTELDQLMAGECEGTSDAYISLTSIHATESSTLRVMATAFESLEALQSYKTTVDKAQTATQTFGELVNWGTGSLDGLEFCLCCNPTTGMMGPGSMPGLVNPGNQSLGPGRTQTRLTDASSGKINTEVMGKPSTLLSSPFVPAKNPAWLAERESIYDTIKQRRDEELALKPQTPIQVVLPDGTLMGRDAPERVVKEGDYDVELTSWNSTPLDVARMISDGLANVAVVARVTHTKRFGDMDAVTAGSDGMDALDESENAGELWDLNRVLEGDCKVSILTFDSDDEAAKAVFWHSSAHVLGQSLEHNHGALLTIGPPIAGGFYYDAYMGDGDGISEKQLDELETEFKASVKRKEKFERLVVTKDEALELFQYSPFKTALITAKVPEHSRTTVYRNGDLIDLCMGPHVPHTGKIKAFKVLRSSASQWLGDVNNDPLQRVYGISFPSKKLLKVHLANLEAAKERDHRRLGAQQKLFLFHKLSPGSAFFLPHGTIIYNTLCDFIRTQYRRRGYSEVVSPNIYNLKLWEQSGHALHYKDDMFTFDVEGEEWGMKPMNCPGHCLLFGSMARSYRELPMRIADFGVLHRNEQSGALTGLTRVRRFQQDDAHIFCEESQIQDEVVACLEFMKFVYDIFGMSYKLELSTRPKKALGEQELWDRAEGA